jgi:hypothetical protein
VNHPSQPHDPNPKQVSTDDMSSADFQLDAYIDGTLPPEQAVLFERRLADDASLASQVDAARRIDAELREMFAVPAAGAALGLQQSLAAAIGPEPTTAEQAGRTGNAVVHQATLGSARPPRGRGRLARVAAAGMLLVVAALAFVFFTGGVDRTVLAKEYEQQVASGFKPAIVCTTNEAFAQWTTLAFAQPLEPRGLGSNVELLGWSTSNLVPNYAGLLLARVDGKDVMVVMDKPKEFGAAADGKIGSLRTFERRVGPVRLIEVTPFEKPLIVDSIVAVPGAKAGESSGTK